MIEWTPFKSIVHNASKRGFPFFVLLLMASGLPLVYYALTRDTNTAYFTTTLDIEHQRVLDTPVPLRPKENFFVESAKFIRLAYESAAGDSERLMMLASPSTKYLNIRPGLRKEEIASIFGASFSWSEAEQESFIANPKDEVQVRSEGYYYPGTYAVLPGMSPKEASGMMIKRFNEEVVPRYASSTRSVISMATALKVASLIEREAGGKSDMRLISGIIWNRIFAGMNLQIDATLQYVKGTENNGWWPAVSPKDKLIDSPYNTYQNGGFPPSAISNPSLAAISAALNPVKTKCMFYLHDNNRKIHCAANYEDHVKNIRKHL